MGTPLIFTIVSGAKEYLSELLTRREEAERRKEEERTRAEEEVKIICHLFFFCSLEFGSVGADVRSARPNGYGTQVRP